MGQLTSLKLYTKYGLRYKTLVKHRFASHVCQTFIEVAADTVTREVCKHVVATGIILLNVSHKCRETLVTTPEAHEDGELLLMKDLILDACEVSCP